LRIPDELIAYHSSGQSLVCRMAISPYVCEFFHLAELGQFSRGTSTYVPGGYTAFATNGAGEIFAIAPEGRIVCLDAAAMLPKEALHIASCWVEFVSLLHPT
jgi:hypothetical protein